MGTATSAAAPERDRWPRVAGTPHPRLRPLVPSGYAGFTRTTTPTRFLGRRVNSVQDAVAPAS